VLRGLSPLISSAILLASTIAIGYLIYNYASTSTSAIIQKPQLIISANADYVGSKAYVEVSIKNAGGAAANITSVKIDNVEVKGSLFSGSYYLLRPGSELHRVVELNNLASGSHIIIVTLSDGSEFKASFIS